MARVKKRVRGISKQRKLLQQLPERMKKSIKKAIEESGELYRMEMVQKIPANDIDLKNSLKFKTSKKGFLGRIGYTPKAGFKREWKLAGWRAHWTELGTVPHLIKSKKQMSDGKVNYGKVVFHPGTTATPFFDITILQNRGIVHNMMYNVLKNDKKFFEGR